MQKIQRITQPPVESIGQTPNIQVGLTSLQGFELAQRAAQLLSSSTLVPTTYREYVEKKTRDGTQMVQNKSARANCVVALNMAARMNADPLMIMQNLHIIEGRPSWSSQWIISAINNCGRFSPLRYDLIDLGEKIVDYTVTEWVNGSKSARSKSAKIQNLQCVAWVIEKSSGERLTSPAVSIEMAVKEGWYYKAGSKWQTMPEVMLRYRASSFFGKLYAPELLMGLPAVEELHDIYDAVQTESGAYSVEPEADQNPIKSANPPESKAEAAQEAELGETDQESDGDVYQLVNTETGEITGDVDPYEDLKLALSQCTRRDEVRDLVRQLTTEQKKNQEIRNLCTARGSELGE